MESEEIVLHDKRKNGSSIGQKILEFSNIWSKTIVVLFFCVLSIVLLLFTRFVTFTEPRASLSIGFNRMALLGILFSGQYELHYSSSTLDFVFTVPQFVPIIFLVLLLAIVCITLLVLWFGIFKQKDIKQFGWPLIAIGCIFFVVFILFITSKGLRAVDRQGDELPFFNVYDTSMLLVLMALVFIVLGLFQLLLKVETMRRVKKFWFSYLLLVIPTVAMLLFNFYPIFMQCVMSFKDYKLADGIWGSPWVGMQWFDQIFSDSAILQVIGNSLYLAILRILAGMLPPLILAIFLYDMAFQKLKGPFQTILYIPHFFSWVVIYAVFYAFFFFFCAINQILRLIVGDNEYYVDFLTNPKNIVPIIIISGIWKEVGWGTILYLAALSGVDPTLYEAASLDGAGAMRKLWHITLPGISSVVVFLFILSMGSVLNNGLEQIMLFANTVVRDKVYTIELWVYNQGIGKMEYGISSAVGFFQSLIGLILVLFCNWLSRKTVDRGLW